MYRVEFTRSARKELESLSDSILARVFSTIESLPENPRPRGCKKLKGSDQLWRIRIGDYRIVYVIDDQARSVDIRAIRHRSDVYG